jgi:hypothetical protein
LLDGSEAHILLLQSDGDLRLYSSNGSILWCVNTSDDTNFLAHLDTADFTDAKEQECLVCAPGKFKSRKGGGTCVDCAAGTYVETGSSSCLTCSSAISVNAVRSTACKECTVGTHYVIAKRPTNYSAEAVLMNEF